MAHAPSRLSSLLNGMEFLSSFYDDRLVPGQWQMVLRAYSSGVLAVNTTVNGYSVNYNGEWVQ
ncbi:hypothetical protein [Streptococcus sp. 1343]|uniref:hypothetical protein n=1 Tax=Streptococcus sp. 1343 TaxID=2582641 RepID=UPI001F046952|nr:hypothetical protein [Streptococcus sp. 1343]